MNPFRDSIVASPWETARVDVDAIHRGVFDQCLEGIEHVRDAGQSAALLIHGEAGSGKTHLLRRLRAHLTPQAPSATHRSEYLYVWVRLQTSPRMIWRTLRRTLVEDWFRPIRGLRTQFERILFHRFAQIRTAEGDLERWYDYMLDSDPHGLKELLDQIADSLHLDRNTAVAFEHIAFGRHQRELRAWLGGDSLPEAALARMDLAQDEGTDEEREDQSRHIVLMLCHLAGNGLPIVISFDQVEALQMVPGDRDALFAFGQMTSTLHDSTTNVLLVACVQSAFATELKDHARRADYDRMTSLGAFSLDPLSQPEATQLIAARLKHSNQLIPADVSDGDCWPLSRSEFAGVFSQGHVSPRRLLGLCAERLESWTRHGFTDPASDANDINPVEPSAQKDVESATDQLAAFLSEKWDSTLVQKRADNTPERTEDILRHGLPLLMRLVAPDVRLIRDELSPNVSLVFQCTEGLVGLSVCTQPNMNSLAHRLKRLRDEFDKQRIQRLVIVRDDRVPLTSSAKKAQQYLKELEDQQAEIQFPSVEVLAAVDALRELLSDAKSGDLDWHGTAVPPEAVENWLRANMGQGLKELVSDVLGKRSEPPRRQVAIVVVPGFQVS